jgi:hypothetical protein
MMTAHLYPWPVHRVDLFAVTVTRRPGRNAASVSDRFLVVVIDA